MKMKVIKLIILYFFLVSIFTENRDSGTNNIVDSFAGCFHGKKNMKTLRYYITFHGEKDDDDDESYENFNSEENALIYMRFPL